MKIVFCGLIGQGTSSLEHLINAGIEVALVITEPAEENTILKKKLETIDNLSKHSLREYIKYNRIKDLCAKNKIEYIEVANKSELIVLKEKIKTYNPEILAASTFHLKIPAEILELFRYAINVHPSLLPKYRGASPIMWALVNNEKLTGVSVHLITDEYDAGD
ncbi:MAG TPA: formyltransferase family protein, partial [bacterium]|nr:formyltransferase family protein [bacterium]